jgi:hypothetical protein
LRERFVGNKRPLNLTHIFPKKEKKLEIRTLRKAILMSNLMLKMKRGNSTKEVEKTRGVHNEGQC